MSSPIVAALRLLGVLLLTFAALPAYAVLLVASTARAAAYSRGYWRLVARLCGFTIRVHGAPVTPGPVLFVANHASYFDILILGALLKARFVAKSEVAGWPGLGFLARLSGTLFVERRPGGSAREAGLMARVLDRGESLILFPEGTSNDGNRVLAFKSSLFAAAETVVVQPVSVAYAVLDRAPMPRAFRPFFAWYGGMTLVDHLFFALGLGDATVDVVFHPPVLKGDFPDRKALANHCHDVIAHGLGLALAGRLPATSFS